LPEIADVPWSIVGAVGRNNLAHSNILGRASLAIVSAVVIPALPSAEFIVTTDGLSLEQQHAVRVAADQWSACLEMPVDLQ
jgi:hypothetical protein